MPALEWKQIARADLLAIVGYIADDNPETAQELKNEIEARASALLAHPQMYKSGRVPGTREMVVRSNYVLVYAENADSVCILRVLHAAQQWP